MTRMGHLRHAYVEFIPSDLEPGVIYISKKYRTASHLCCCGCGFKVVTPLNPAKWKLTDHGQTVSLFPSIGNWSFPCKSHYWLDHGRVRWAGVMSKQQIVKVQRWDRLEAERHASSTTNLIARIGKLLHRWFGGN
jgi:hypothetical protein